MTFDTRDVLKYFVVVGARLDSNSDLASAIIDCSSSCRLVTLSIVLLVGCLLCFLFSVCKHFILWRIVELNHLG